MAAGRVPWLQGGYRGCREGVVAAGRVPWLQGGYRGCREGAAGIAGRAVGASARVSGLMMSIGNQKFGIPRKYQYQIGIWYFCTKFLGIFLVFYRYFENDLVKIWLNIGIFGRIKNRFSI